MVAEADPWKHRSQGMRCASCLWFVVKKAAGAAAVAVDGSVVAPTLGRCRRHAPTMSGYPAVFEHDWCGDHKLDENKL
jgi:hypothetical protein